MIASWKLLYGSVTGTSHQGRGEGCQDYALGRTVWCEDGAVLVVACADGAGTAAHSRIGARLACTEIIRLVAAALEDGVTVGGIDAVQMLGWHEKARNRLSFEACFHNVPRRDFACTLLTCVVGEREAIFSQIGDGTIVLHEGDRYLPVFWPQNGEYASTTYFLTDHGYEDRLAFAAFPHTIDELAVVTDGLQMLALHYATRSVHPPFFDPLFQQLRTTLAVEELDEPLKQFLSSAAVNDRTDDDKTLVLATRRRSDDSP